MSFLVGKSLQEALPSAPWLNGMPLSTAHVSCGTPSPAGEDVEQISSVAARDAQPGRP